MQDSYCPVLNDGTYVLYSSRGWGDVMAKAYGLYDEYAYMNFYMDEHISPDKKKYPKGYPDDDFVVPKESLAETFVMHLRDDMFDLIKSGVKNVELRLFDDKRKLIDIGDYIEFVKESDKTQRIKKQVGDIEVAKTFEELFMTGFLPNELGFVDCSAESETYISEMAQKMYEYYDKEQEKKYGVIAFVLQEPKHTCRTCLTVWTNDTCARNLQLQGEMYREGADDTEFNKAQMDVDFSETLSQEVIDLLGKVEEGYAEVFDYRSVEIGRNEDVDVDVNVMLRKTLKHLFGKEAKLKSIRDRYWISITLDIVATIVKDTQGEKINLNLDEDIKEFLDKSKVELEMQVFEV